MDRDRASRELKSDEGRECRREDVRNTRRRRRCHCPSRDLRTLVVDLTRARLRCITTEISRLRGAHCRRVCQFSIILVAMSPSSSSHLSRERLRRLYVRFTVTIQWRVSVYVRSVVIPSIYSCGRSCRISILGMRFLTISTRH